MAIRPVTTTAIMILASTTLVACSGDDKASPNTVRMAVTDLQGLEELQREFGDFKEKLAKSSGYDIEFFPVNDRVAAAGALKSNKVDIVFTGPAEYVALHARTGAEPLVSISRPSYKSCIYTKKDSGKNSLADLKGSKVGMSDVGSTSGHLGPSQMLKDAGLDTKNDLKIMNIGDAVHPALERGDIDAVGLGCGYYKDNIKGKEDQFKLISEGETLPPDVILHRKGMESDKVEKLRTTFKDNWTDLHKAMLAGKDNAKYSDAKLSVAKDSDFDVVRSMYKAVGVNDFERFM